jgi:hypothetical protein
MNKPDCKQLILQNMDYIVTDLQASNAFGCLPQQFEFSGF